MTNSTTKITRRQFGTGAAAGAVGLAGMMEPLHADQMQKTFILVHGAWHGGWCWRRVADLLQAQGHKVFTPTLTGLGEKSHLRQDETGLDTHVTDILNLIEWEDLSDIVLVGHSYGGMVITGVANALADKIEAIVYLDAFKPDEGDSVASMADPKTSAYMHKLWDDGTRAWGPLPVDYFSVLPENTDWVTAKMTPQPLRTFLDPSGPVAGGAVIARKTYVRALKFPSLAFDAALAATRGDAGWNTLELDYGHDVMIDYPSQLAAILQDA